MEKNEDITQRLSHLKRKESELQRLKVQQEKEIRDAQQRFFRRTTRIEQYIHNFFTAASLAEHYRIVLEDIPAVTLIQYANGECLLFYMEAVTLDAESFTIHSGYILDKDHREEIFDFGASESLPLAVTDIDESRFDKLNVYLHRVVLRHVKFVEECLEKGYIRRTLHETIKNPWQ